MLAVQRLVNGSKQEHSLNSLLSSQQLAVVLAQIAVIFSMLHQKRCWCNPDKYIVRTVNYTCVQLTPKQRGGSPPRSSEPDYQATRPRDWRVGAPNIRCLGKGHVHPPCTIAACVFDGDTYQKATEIALGSNLGMECMQAPLNNSLPYMQYYLQQDVDLSMAGWGRTRLAGSSGQWTGSGANEKSARKIHGIHLLRYEYGVAFAILFSSKVRCAAAQCKRLQQDKVGLQSGKMSAAVSVLHSSSTANLALGQGGQQLSARNEKPGTWIRKALLSSSQLKDKSKELWALTTKKDLGEQFASSSAL
ncbi:hypothetical protein Trihar35433_966 [Trichoderma harzianum]|nr:hypothetical protein Trihar35433_966 [Trichoderma harzianum]